MWAGSLMQSACLTVSWEVDGSSPPREFCILINEDTLCYLPTPATAHLAVSGAEGEATGTRVLVFPKARIHCASFQWALQVALELQKTAVVFSSLSSHNRYYTARETQRHPHHLKGL